MNLPRDISILVLEQLDFTDLIALSVVNLTYRDLCNSNVRYKRCIYVCKNIMKMIKEFQIPAFSLTNKILNETFQSLNCISSIKKTQDGGVTDENYDAMWEITLYLIHIWFPQMTWILDNQNIGLVRQYRLHSFPDGMYYILFDMIDL